MMRRRLDDDSKNAYCDFGNGFNNLVREDPKFCASVKPELAEARMPRLMSRCEKNRLTLQILVECLYRISELKTLRFQRWSADVEGSILEEKL